MKFTVQQADLAPLLKRAAEVAKASATTPLLGMVRLSAGEHGLRVEATDLEISIAGTIQAEEVTRGTFCLPAKEFAAVVARLPRGPVVVKTDTSKATVTAEQTRTKFSLTGLDADAYPTLPKPDGIDMVEVPGSMLRDLLDRAGYAASKDESRPALCSVYVGPQHAIATDGHRAAFLPGLEVVTSAPILIPAEGLRELARVAADFDRVSVGTDGTWFVLQAQRMTVSVRLEGTAYPDAQQVITSARQTAWAASFDRTVLLDALGRAKNMGVDVGMSLAFGAGEAVLTASNPEFGSYTETLDVEVTGEPPRIGANRLYLEASIKAAQGERVVMGGRGAMDAFTITSQADEAQHVVMPMRLP